MILGSVLVIDATSFEGVPQNRQRPYAYYNEGTLIPEKEEKHRNEGSYPSGHTVFGWASALLLADINQ